MKYNPDIHHRRSIRLKGYDYSGQGAYFVTICTKNMECLFGEIIEKKMILNELGKIAEKCWLEIPKHYPDVILDEFVIMPNHVHGILFLRGDEIFPPSPLRAQNLVPVTRPLPDDESKKVNQFQKIIPKSVGAIIRGYKIGVTKWARSNTQIQVPWHRNDHERIIRSEKSLNNIRNYILRNPENWKADRFLVT